MNKVLVRAYAERLGRERGGGVTAAEAREEMSAIVERVARGIAGRFVFGFHTREDMEHEAVVIGLEVLALDPPRYDPSRPLENFLHVHVRNQLSNYKRKHYSRPEPPCDCCDPFDPPEEPCRKMREWRRRNVSKQNIMRPIGLDSVRDGGGREEALVVAARAEGDAEAEEMLSRIDRHLPAELRADYLRMRDRVTVPKVRRRRVQETVLDILHGGVHDG